jgi:hypothetical protein
MIMIRPRPKLYRERYTTTVELPVEEASPERAESVRMPPAIRFSLKILTVPPNNYGVYLIGTMTRISGNGKTITGRAQADLGKELTTSGIRD